MKNETNTIEDINFHLVNIERKKHNSNTLIKDFGLRSIARSHSGAMAHIHKVYHGNNVHIAGQHVKFKGNFLSKIIDPLFYEGISGENCAEMLTGRVVGIPFYISSDHDIAKALHYQWMHSPGHRANILNEKFKKMGLGIKRHGNKFYATQVFYG